MFAEAMITARKLYEKFTRKAPLTPTQREIFEAGFRCGWEGHKSEMRGVMERQCAERKATLENADED